MNLEQLMQNKYAWLILSICTILSCIYGIFISIKSREKKQISYLINTYKIINAGENVIPKIEILYDGKYIRDLTVSRLVIWNSGNKLLNGDDIVDTKQLSVVAESDKVDILDVSIVKYNEEANKFRVDMRDSHHAEIKFDYVDKRDGIVIQILHTGSYDDIFIRGKIKGGKKLRNIEKHNDIIKNDKVRKYIYVIDICIATITIISLTVLLIFDYIGSIPDESFLKSVITSDAKPLTIEYILIMAIFSIVFIVMAYRVLKKVFHLNVPSGLRSEVEYENKS